MFGKAFFGAAFYGPSYFGEGTTIIPPSPGQNVYHHIHLRLGLGL